MRRFSDGLRFWSVALAAVAIVLFGSVEAGRVVAGQLLARGVVAQAPLPELSGPIPPEVIGGQPHALAIPGEPSPIWSPPQRERSSTHARPAPAPAPQSATSSTTSQPAAPIVKAVPGTSAHRTVLPVRRQPNASQPPGKSGWKNAPTETHPVQTAVRQERAEPAAQAAAVVSPPVALSPIVQITPPGQNLGF